MHLYLLLLKERLQPFTWSRELHGLRAYVGYVQYAEVSRMLLGAGEGVRGSNPSNLSGFSKFQMLHAWIMCNMETIISKSLKNTILKKNRNLRKRNLMKRTQGSDLGELRSSLSWALIRPMPIGQTTETFWVSIFSLENWCNEQESIARFSSAIMKCKWKILNDINDHLWVCKHNVWDVLKEIFFLNVMTFCIINVLCGSHRSLDVVSHNWCLISVLP